MTDSYKSKYNEYFQPNDVLMGDMGKIELSSRFQPPDMTIKNKHEPESGAQLEATSIGLSENCDADTLQAAKVDASEPTLRQLLQPSVAEMKEAYEAEFCQHLQKTDKLFKCDICQKGLSTEKILRKHRKDHFDKKFFQCDLCEKKFVTKDSLNVHHRSHTGEKPFACDICHKAYTVKGSLYKHYDRHLSDKDKSFMCDICPTAFSRKSLLTVHLRTHIREEERLFVCDVCQKRFPCKADLSKHVYLHKSQAEKHHVCTICQKGFRQRTELENHFRNHTGERPFVCDVCSMTFSQKSCLKVHYTIHKNDRPFKCDVCNNTFKRKPALLRHHRTHSVQKCFICDICGKDFKHKESLNIHSRIHTGIKPYVCGECQASFISKRRLDRHMTTHTGQKPFICNICQSGFFSENYRMRHKLIHNNEQLYVKSQPNIQITGSVLNQENINICDMNKPDLNQEAGLLNELDTEELDYNCNFCVAVFDSEVELMQHILTHSTEEQDVYNLHETSISSNADVRLNPCVEKIFKCGVCQDTFTNEADFKNHVLMLVHYDEKSYRVSDSTIEANLVRHQLSNSNEKTFDCNLCKAAFDTEDNLSIHQLIHNADKRSTGSESVINA